MEVIFEIALIMGVIGFVVFFIIRRKKVAKRQQEEEGRKQEKLKEENKLKPNGKSLEWFSSEDGLKVFNEYITPQGYILEETLEKEKEEKYGDDHELDFYVNVLHKDAKIPYMYFKGLIDNIESQALDYVGPSKMLIRALSVQAKPFYLDEDGEPKPKENAMLPKEIVSMEKNPVLNFVANFTCFKLANDEEGSLEDKWELWKEILIYLSIDSIFDKEVLTKNKWIFEKDTYFNNLGTVRKLKGFYKKCIELATNKKYFEKKLEECE